MSDSSNTVEASEEMSIAVLETDFSELLKITKLVNFADSVDAISLPKHISHYSNNENIGLEQIIRELLEFYQNEDEKWRINSQRAVPIVTEDDSIKIPGKILHDAGRIVIISKLNSIFIFPGERSIKEGSAAPNEVIRLINMVATKSFLMQLTDVANENDTSLSLKVNFIPIDNINNENNDSQ